ncbi:sigma-54-dependent Fis family transcriptional regulator [Apibacter muscae]|uniref:Sigma-54-dependent Fis family transcriptional regulator n=1 Tax=Apibacter muscae TaxID=2509004 RepID=A0A563DKC5_9FLAO|nr:sigma-54 dependent transcriptional regulator [Apibacter muscae]TWP30630.1 sigma-54-dependent Fis family transcriptional regulator [Apibacter muscae]TWP31466.1 sigma-54-dependent Fis family transcriptional regulator [Apibacter muscae]
MDSLQIVKQRFGIIGNNLELNRALEKSMQVAPTDISVLVIGESGVGKEFIPKIIHNLSPRKHKQYIAVNCGAIPEGTIDSELFGHEKGAFTGADKVRKGYFEVADGGTIFLDEVGELPLQTQVRLLRVLESGEFMKVGSSNIQKTNVRIVAATNVNLLSAIKKGDFREDLYYRLNTIQIDIPALRNRRDDIPLLLRKFAVDFSEKYRMPTIAFSDEAMAYIQQYYWPGNIRQLRNFAEQVTVVETKRELTLEKVKEYLKDIQTNTSLVNISNTKDTTSDFSTEREILYKILFDMKKDLNDLKTLTLDLIKNKGEYHLTPNEQDLFHKVYKNYDSPKENESLVYYEENNIPALNAATISNYHEDIDVYEDIPSNNSESLSLQKKEEELIKKALEKYNGKRKLAAQELGISERTLYRKIKQYDIEE